MNLVSLLYTASITSLYTPFLHSFLPLSLPLSPLLSLFLLPSLSLSGGCSRVVTHSAWSVYSRWSTCSGATCIHCGAIVRRFPSSVPSVVFPPSPRRSTMSGPEMERTRSPSRWVGVLIDPIALKDQKTSYWLNVSVVMWLLPHVMTQDVRRPFVHYWVTVFVYLVSNFAQSSSNY